MASISTRERSNGQVRYEVRYRHLGKDRSRTFITLKKAESWRRLLEVSGPEVAEGVFEDDTSPGSAWSFGSWARHHLDTLDATTGTKEGYETVLKAVPKRLKDTALTSVTRDQFREHALNLASTRAQDTVRGHLNFLSSVMNAAVSEGHIPNNPAKGVKAPKKAQKAKPIVPLERDEVPILIEATPEPYRLFVRFLVGTGLRFGEATALTVGDFNPHKKIVTVTKAWKVGEKGRRYLGEPKSQAGLRSVGVPPALVNELSEHVNGKDKGDLIFTGPKGGRLSQSTFSNTWNKKVQPVILKKTGKTLRVHDLRHTAVSIALQSGVASHIVSKLAGHGGIGITLSIYGHLLTDDTDTMAGALDF